ncbi:rRNA processing/ribosome biogenesis-domain-containing protein [Ephemerocybe angulata]|uniref:rRNA processing/ribosome biogenesis-domain-containing protein n=1 Tax=Ephemerocybe angulata TaxID=980116 RepID=A0A8H6IBQ7_9AGAR|nr:rRNA processing/ribosome biogenesis-domain-containing protein [Tulosesus angulatus]
MDAGFQLKSLLQLQLASDSSSVAHLPYILNTLNEDCFAPNPHLAKWSARINSLLHSKDAGARWTGLCIAHKSSLTSKTFMLESAAVWLPVVIPMLSRPEPTPMLKAGIRLLITVFTTATEMSEFQRQISLPNVTKFTNALASLAGAHADVELKELCLDTLARLIPIYPNAHRATFGHLSGLALSFLNGSYPRPTSTPLLEAAARLYSILHLTGGKVGAANLWRKALDDNLAFGWEALNSVRTTFPTESRNVVQVPEGTDPSIHIPLNVDRIRCCSVIIRDLLHTMITRPVQIPAGQLIKYALALISASTEGQVDGFVDPTTRAMELSVVPALWKYGCEIISTLADSIPQYLEPNLPRIYTVLAYRLEQPLTQHQRVHVLAAIQKLLQTSRFVDAPILPNRITRAVLPSLVVILSSSATNVEAHTDEASGKSKKGKKKAKNYAGDEVFKVSRDVICPTDVDSEVLLLALDVVRHCIQNPNLSSSQLSLASRVLLSIQLSLSQLSPSILSPNPQVFPQIQKKVNAICTEIASSSSVSLQKTLPLIARECVKIGDTELHASLDLLIHPRLPPIVRPIPTTQSLSLFRVEESEEEASARSQLGLDFEEGADEQNAVADQDAVMQDGFVSATPAPAQQEPPKELPRQPFLPSAPVVSQPSVPAAVTPLPWQPKEAVVIQSTTVTSTTTRTTTSAPAPASDDSQDEDEEMPTIDLGSDSEDEED